MMKRYGSVEAGGTKFICAVGNENNEIIISEAIPTTTYEETIKKVIVFFEKNRVDALAIGSFGPVDLDISSEQYGCILNTPKQGWTNVNIVLPIQKALNIPIFFTTDVNSSAYGEMHLNGCNNLVYYTIGTGIGGSAIQNGVFIGGIGHPEMGHQLIKKHPLDVNFNGVCPLHGDCLEGLASGPSIEARTGKKGQELEINSTVWDIQAYYIAQAILNTTLVIRPELVIVGGGVMSQHHMLDRIKMHFKKLLNNYVTIEDIDKYIKTPSVENNGSATIGNFLLAKNLLIKN
ncbi:fructokinase/branched chain amino acid--2-keto-4-methylthiobutyrate aminotransferase [Gilliamella apicola]|uniref:fructokinase n=1 Tax=Gilliamella apicola TaxID=1196095 RepID=A0A2V4DSW3_9GAMM|nr:fructokinase/branched chain amino acid--2-keto-4-methylthiobutyrate aminotransferase [Gilliamella apicola]